MDQAPRCAHCGAELAVPKPSLCPLCAQRARRRIARYFKVRALVGLILALLVFGFFMVFDRQSASETLLEPDHLIHSLAATPIARRALYAGAAFLMAFGYFGSLNFGPSGPADARDRGEMEARLWGAFGNRVLTQIGSVSGEESAGLGWLIVCLALSPVTGPVCIVLNLVRLARLSAGR